MTNNLECPFCGIEWVTAGTGDPRHPDKLSCPLSNYYFSSEQWARRPDLSPSIGEIRWVPDHLRAHFASLAMQGLLSSSQVTAPSDVAYQSVKYADALLKALEEKP